MLIVVVFPLVSGVLLVPPNRSAIHNPVTSSVAGQAPSTWTEDELYFGALIPTGGIVTDSLWEDFLDKVVTPRFPQGFTCLDALGRYQYKNGEIRREPTRIVMLLYDSSERSNERKVHEIAETYKDRFAQESVLRVTSNPAVKFYR